MRCYSLGLSLLLLFGVFARAQSTPPKSAPRPLPTESMSRCQRAYASLQPSARNWVDTQARAAVQHHALSIPQLRASVLERFPSLRNSHDGSVEAMMLALLKDAIEDANNDKNYYLQKLADINTVSQALNNQIAQLAQGQARPGRAPSRTRTRPRARRPIAALSHRALAT